MIIYSNFPVCGNCSQKEERTNLKHGCFYCHYVVDIFKNGIVTNDIDGTECLHHGYYSPL